MSVKIRLRRDGAKKRPFYHVVAADSRRARNGRFIEELGYYNPIVAADAEPILVLKEERIRYWLGVGAQPSETAAALLKKQGILERTVAATVPVNKAAAAKAAVKPADSESVPAPDAADATEPEAPSAEPEADSAA
ncbi:MAG: 30S ribosomal protein S16 [Cytophagales bacterium]|nr:30S ribosomal protein S16 [Armatimonadota bacterium]